MLQHPGHRRLLQKLVGSSTFAIIRRSSFTMQALHLPFLPTANSKPAYSYPDKPPPASSLVYTASGYPRPSFEKYQKETGQIERNETEGRDLSAQHQDQPLYLIRVHTTALTRGELTWDEIVYPSRFTTTTAPIPGHDVVGIVEEVHQSTSEPKFKPGDMVWGFLEWWDGAAAAFTIATDNEIALAPKFHNASRETPSSSSTTTTTTYTSDATAAPANEEEWEAMLATVPLSALTAWQALFEQGGLAEPDMSPDNAPATSTSKEAQAGGGVEPLRLLIIGASGSVGVFAVQLARIASVATSASQTRPIHITAVCGVRNADFVKSLGADVVLSYDAPEQQTPKGAQWSLETAMQSQHLQPFDLALDFVGGGLEKSLLSSAQCLKDSGRLITIIEPVTFPTEPAVSEERKEMLETHFFIVKPSHSQLEKLASLVGAGRLIGFVDRVLPLARGQEGMEAVETRGAVAKGKVVLRVNV